MSHAPQSLTPSSQHTTEPISIYLANAEPRRFRLFQSTQLSIWDASEGALRLTLEGHQSWVNVLSMSPSGKQLLSIAQDRSLVMWKLQSREVSDPVIILRPSPPGGCLQIAPCADDTWACADHTSARGHLQHQAKGGGAGDHQPSTRGANRYGTSPSSCCM
jgi:hypothetical protein